jgi:hypothetical protein
MSREGANPFMEKLVLITAENIAMAASGAAGPQSVHFDIAYLVHGLPEKMSQGADIEAMCAVLTKAGNHIFGDHDFGAEENPVAVWNRNLRHFFSIHRYGLQDLRNAAGRVKRTLRRLGFSI